MFKRKILSKLEAWKQDERHKPLILRGARQVGKTTVVNEFGSQFDNYLYFNLDNKRERQIVRDGHSIKRSGQYAVCQFREIAKRRQYAYLY